VTKRKIALKVEVLNPEEFSEELVEALVAALEGKEEYLALEELKKLLGGGTSVSYEPYSYTPPEHFDGPLLSKKVLGNPHFRPPSRGFSRPNYAHLRLPPSSSVHLKGKIPCIAGDMGAGFSTEGLLRR